MDYIERFNIQLYNFFSELYILYPVDNDIYNIKNKIYMAKIIGSESLYKEFIINIGPYKDKILKRDEKYLLTIDNIFINKFKNYYTMETDTNKKIIWDYLGVLIILSDKINY